MKMMLLLFLDDVASERELLKIIPLRLDYLWFLGFGLNDSIPNHSVLSKARRRWGSEVFEELFARSVEQCAAAGLVEGHKLHIDASLVAADASRNSVVRQVVLGVVGKLDDAGEEPSAAPAKSKVNDSYQSTTEPEASVIRHSGHGKSTPCYKHHRAIDDAAGVITAVATTTGAVDEATQLLPLIEQSHARTGVGATVAVTDDHHLPGARRWNRNLHRHIFEASSSSSVMPAAARTARIGLSASRFGPRPRTRLAMLGSRARLMRSYFDGSLGGSMCQ